MTIPTQPKFSDAAKRCSDEVALQVALGNVDKYIAIRLADGGSDHVAYDRWKEAAWYHRNAVGALGVIKVPYDGMPIREAEMWLKVQRKVHDSGFRFTDPEGPDLIMPSTQEQLAAALRDVTTLRMGRRHDN